MQAMTATATMTLGTATSVSASCGPIPIQKGSQQPNPGQRRGQTEQHPDADNPERLPQHEGNDVVRLRTKSQSHPDLTRALRHAERQQPGDRSTPQS